MTESSKRRLVWPLIIFSCAPLLFIVAPPGQLDTNSVLLYLSALAGYVGVMFLLWMYILGAKSALALVFKDLAPVLSIHKKLGMWGSIAFLLHPLLVAFSYFDVTVKSLMYIVLPDISTAMERHVTLGRTAFYIIILVWLTSKVVRKQLGFRAWKYLHYFAYVALPFALLHVPELGSQYIAHLPVKIYFWMIVGALGVFTLFRLGGWLNLDRRNYQIISHTRLTQDDFMMVLRPLGKKHIAPRIGQYVYLKKGILSEDHPFSVTYYDITTGDITLTYRVFGSFTKYLTYLPAGNKASLMGPFGAFTADLLGNNQQPAVYLAGGVGITPFVQRIIDESATRAQILFAANRTHSSAVLVPMLKNILGDRMVAIYSREEPYDESEEYGHINEDIILRHVPSPLAFMYYICGPQEFVKECRRVLKAIGVPNEQVAEEEFSW